MTDALLDIQHLDVSADQLRHRRDNLPARATLEQALADQRAQQDRIDEVAMARVDVANRQRRLENEAQIVSDRADADEAKLYSGEVKGLKDLEALQHEITTLRDRQRGFEDETLEAMEEAEVLAARIAELEAARQSADERVSVLRAEIEALEAEIDDELARVAADRSSKVGEVDGALLAEYERLRPAFGAATAVMFDGSRCVGCPSTMPAMEVDRLKHLDGTDPAACSECGRIVLR
jgi:predicted  nucleic acid-binding Zn-ribbon protein